MKWLSRANRRVALAGLMLCSVVLAGCGGGSAVDAEQAHANAAKNWRMHLDWAGSDVELPLEVMDIYLVEEEERWPEVFEIRGEGVALVGTFPMDLHVGYEADLERLVGRTIPISPTSGGDRYRANASFVKLAGMNVPVSGGSVTFEKLTGKWAGSNGDFTVWGTIELRVAGADGDQTLKGALAVHAVTWG